MIEFLKQVMFYVVGRRVSYRGGRAMYQKARGDVPNEMSSNGEMLVQRCVVKAWEETGLGGQRLVVFDVGANVGDWSFALLTLLKASEKREAVDIYAFEPVPSTYKVLKNRLGSQNGVLHCEQVALSSKSGEDQMYVSCPSAGTNSLHAEGLRSDKERITIVKTTATDVCNSQSIRKIHLFKCDTEGHDMEVIRGALQLLLEGRISVLQFEYNYRWVFSRNYLRDVFAAVENLPYRLAKVQPHQLLIFSEWHPELERFFEGNYALVHVDVLNWFPTQLVSWDRYNSMTI